MRKNTNDNGYSRRNKSAATQRRTIEPSAGIGRTESKSGTIGKTIAGSENGERKTKSENDGVMRESGIARIETGNDHNGTDIRTGIDGGFGSGGNRPARTGANSTTGTGTNQTTVADTKSGQLASELEAPPIVKVKRKYTKRGTKKVETSNTDLIRDTLTAFLGTSVNTLFFTLSLKFGKHWELTEDEVAEVAIKLDDAFQTLPGDYYEIIATNLGKVAPWLAVAAVAHSIVTPRITETRTAGKIVAAQNPSKATVDGIGDKQQTSDIGNWRTHSDFASVNSH